MTSIPKRNASWLALAAGTLLGASLTIRALQRRQARKTSPLKPVEATQVALITGASSGIGAAYARALAALGYDLILVARREERLHALAQSLTIEFGVHTAVLVADLATEAGTSSVEQVITQTQNLALLVNNAGFGNPGAFAENGVARQMDMIQVHVMATVRLTRAALPVMLARQCGAIVNVSSIAGFYPIAGNVTYSATKSYLNAFTESLHQELAGTGVRVQALCPGFTHTEFMDAANVSLSGLPEMAWLQPEHVVERSLRDLDNNKVLSVPGIGYSALAQVSRWLPRPWLYALGRQVAVMRRREYRLFGK